MRNGASSARSFAARLRLSASIARSCPAACHASAQSRRLFSVLKATEKLVESHQKKRRPVFDKYAAAVASFVESYIAANQKYPKISEVVQYTGGSRSTIRKILNELNSEKDAVECKGISVNGGDDTKVAHTMHSPNECMPSNIINSKNSAWPPFDKFEQLAQEVESARVEASIDSLDAETDNANIDIPTQNIEKEDPALLTRMDQAMHSSNKPDANRRVAPLMEVLQQKSSGSSRRVHLSAYGGIENDLSWDQTLRSIMPTSVGSKDDTSGLKGEKPKVCRENVGHTSFSSGKFEESSVITSDLNFTIKVTSPKPNSLLRTLSSQQFQDALQYEAEVFKALKDIKFFRIKGKTNAHAILQFKNHESMKKALKLKTITVAGEKFSLQKSLMPAVCLRKGDNNQPERSVFQEVIQGVAGSCGKVVVSKTCPSPTYQHVEEEAAVFMQAQPGSHPSFLQTITIQNCPSNVSLESIDKFFSVFGKIQTSYGPPTTHSIQIVVEFENESEKEKAMKVEQFTADGCSFLLRPASSSLIVQLQYKGSGIDHKAVLKVCKQYGVVESLYLRKSQVIDVTFGVNERHRIDELLNRLRGDTYFKENWKLLPIYEGYARADTIQALNTKEKLKRIVVALKDLVTELTRLLATKDETST